MGRLETVSTANVASSKKMRFWNATNGFVSYLHTRDNANVHDYGLHPQAFAEFAGSQFGGFGPVFLATLRKVGLPKSYPVTRIQALQTLGEVAARDRSAVPVLRYAQAVRHEHVSARGMLLADPQGNLHLDTPIRFEREPGKPNLHVPALGEHTAEVMRVDLGLAAEDVAALESSGVVGLAGAEVHP